MGASSIRHRGVGLAGVRNARGAVRVREAVRCGVEALEGRLLLTAAPTLTGDIRVAGEQDVFSFNFAGPRKLYFDVLTNHNDLRWSLDGPLGAVVTNRPFTQTDSLDVTNPVLSVPAGAYTVTIDGAGDFTGGYQFRLTDLAANADPLPLGVNVNQTLLPSRETDVYTFTAAAGDRFTFDSVGVSNLPGARWRLVDRFDNVVFHNAIAQDATNVTLSAGGAYALLVEGRVFDTAASGNYAFRADFLGNTPPVPFTGTALALGSSVAGTIGAAGEVDPYVFTLASDAGVVFDALGDFPGIRWTLTGPAGVVVNSRNLQSSDSFDHSPPVIPLFAGTYRLDVAGNTAAATGPYGFRVLDLATAVPLTPGTPVSSNLTPATETDLYRFDVTPANNRFYFDVTTAVGNGTWRLVNPRGDLAFNASFDTDQDALTLPLAGTHYLILEGRRNAGAAPAPYAFTVRPAPVSATPLAVGPTINGTIAGPGETDAYTFSLAAAAKLAFDSFTDLGAFRWTLTGPGGLTYVSSRSFQSSDSFDQATPFINLPAGDYTLTVDATADNTGAYAFRLLDYAAATPLTPGTPVSGSLAPATETDLYRFTVAPGETRLFFDVTTGVGNASWRLIDPFDNVVFNTNLDTDVDTLTLTQPGTYFLALEGRRNSGAAPAPYAFTVRPVAVATTPLAFGATTNGTIAVAGENDPYTFTLAAPAKLLFDSFTDNGGFRWTLTGPGGAVFVNSRSFQSSDSFDQATPFINLPAGAYTLTVDGTGDTAGAYGFRLSDYASAVPLTPGTPVNGSLDPGTESDLYRFTAGANQRFYFDVTTGVGNATWRLVDPFDNVVFNTNLATDVDALTLAQPGTYFLVLEGRRNSGVAPAPYAFNVRPTGAGTTALTPGVATNGDIAVPGETDSYTFTTGGGKFAFDSLTDSGSFRWTLTGPGGAVFVSSRSFQSSDSFDQATPFINLPAGGYTLTVDGTDDATGAYAFRFLDYAAATTITPGTPVSSTLTPATETDLYRFTVAAPNERFYFDVMTGVGNATWRLIDPFDNVVFNTNLATDVDALTLAQPGTYFLVLEGRRNSGAAPAPYAFTVRPIAPTAVTPLAFGALASGNIGVAGESDAYTFSVGGGGARLAFDSFTDNSEVQWSLTGPGGAAFVTNRSIQSSDSFERNPLLTLPAGAYTLTVDALSDTTPAYQFRLLNLAAAIPITPGTPVSSTLNPGTETDLYQFTVATPGDQFSFDTTSPTVNGSWRLIDPFGNQLFAGTPSLQTDQPTIALNDAGVYTLLIEGRRNAGAPAQSYTFNVVPQGNTPPTPVTGAPITPGATVSGNISAAGELDDFQFTLPGSGTFYFDSLTNNGNLQWTLAGPGGTLVTNRSFTGSDSLDITDPQLALPAGTYKLTVSGSGTTTGAYSFRLLDLAAATPVTPGTPFTGTLSPAIETDAYRFTAAAGQRLYFDVQERTGATNARWRLIDPLGNLVFNHAFFGSVDTDVDVLVAPLTGTYTLLLEGRFNDTVTGTYTVNVQPVTDSNAPLPLGTTVSGNLATTGESDHFAFTLGTPATLVFDSLTNNADLRWSLTGPGGTAVSNRPFNGSDSVDITDPLLRLPAGSYILTVDGVGDEVAAYQFRLLDLATAISITPGTPFTGTLSPAIETDAYRFTAAAGQRLYFDVQERTGATNARWRLIDPLGNLVFNQAFFGNVNTDVDVLSMPLTGTYTLLLEGRFVDTGTATYTVNVQPETDSTTPLALGATVSGNIAVTGEQDAYTFTLGSAGVLYFDSLTNNADLRWSLTGAGGTAVSNRPFNGSDSADITDPLLRLPAGNYTLTVDAAGDVTAPYQFRLLDLAAAISITPGTPFSGTLNPAIETDAYRFTAAAGQRLYFDVQERTGATNARWRLVDPLGNYVFNNAFFGNVNTDVDVLSMPLTGTYTLLIEGRFNDTVPGTYTVELQPVTDSTTPLVLNATTSGAIANAGEQDHFTFTLGAPSVLYFDSLTNNADLRWSLVGPGGTVVTNRPFNGSDSVDITDPQLRLPAGAYTLTVDAAGDATAPYQFRLLDLAAATPITPGTPFSGTFNPAVETDAYRFDATAGEKLFFDVRARSGAEQARWRLIDPLGNLVFNNAFFGSVNTDIDVITAGLTGTYTLLLEGRFIDVNPGSYIVNVQLVRDGIFPVVASGLFDPDIGPNHAVLFAFSQDVSASLQPGDFTLQNVGTGATFNATGVTYDTENNVATVSMGQTLPEGNYRMTLLAAGISNAFGQTLDGNADGVGGDNFQFDFFFLPGDADGSRTVDFNDLVRLAQRYNTTGSIRFSQGNFNYDNAVNFNDLVLLAQRYNSVLQPPPPPPGPAPTPAAPVAAARYASFAEAWAAALLQAGQPPAPPVVPGGPPKPAPAAKPAPKPVSKPAPAPAAPRPKSFSVTRVTRQTLELPPPRKPAAPAKAATPAAKAATKGPAARPATVAGTRR